MRIDLNAPKGLGDAIYLRAIVLHLLERGDEPTVFTRWPDVFADIPVTVKRIEDVTGEEDLRHAMYCLFCRVPAVKALDQFALACLQAGILEPVALRANWTGKPASKHSLQVVTGSASRSEARRMCGKVTQRRAILI